MADQETPPGGEAPPNYMIFILVLFFFLTGLLGFLICHVLKKKGYRCRTGEPEEECEDKLAMGTGEEEAEDPNQDTVEQILKCIIENEANVEALKEMLVNQNVPDPVDQRLPRKESAGTLPPHHHTVHSGSDRNACLHCVQGRTRKARGRSRVARSKARPGEHTVFSVGRFRVTYIGKKNSITETTNPPTTEQQPADQSESIDHHSPQAEGEPDPSQRKGQEAYNLRSMFKDVSPEVNDGVAQTGAQQVEDVAKKTQAQSETGGADSCAPASPPEKSPAAREDGVVEVTTIREGTLNGTCPVSGIHSSPGPMEDIVLLSAAPGRRREYAVLQMEDFGDDTAQMEDGKDDMVEMEDIKDCRVSRELEGEEVLRSLRAAGHGAQSGEGKRRSIVVHTQHKW